MSFETRDQRIIELGKEAGKRLVKLDRMLVDNPDYLHGVYMALSSRQGEVADGKEDYLDTLMNTLNRLILEKSQGGGDGTEFDHLQFQNEVNECLGLEDVQLAA